MARPAGVTVSAVFLILVSAFTTLIGGIFFIADSLVHPVTPQPPFVKAIMLFTASVFVGFALWGVFTAVGLFRMRLWARMSILVIGALLVIFCGFSVALFVFVVAQQMPELEPTGRAGWVMGIMIGVYVIPILLGLWWLIYFNRAAVKAAFLQGVLPDKSPRRPLSITVIAWHLVVIGLLTPISLWIHFPVPFLGMLLTGWSAALVYCIYAMVELSIGVGLLRLKPWSLNAAIWFCIFLILNSIVFAFVPNATAKMLAAMQGLFPDVSSSAGTVELPSPVLNATFGVLMMALPLFYLVTRKQAFLEAGRKSEIAK